MNDIQYTLDYFSMVLVHLHISMQYAIIILICMLLYRKVVTRLRLRYLLLAQ